MSKINSNNNSSNTMDSHVGMMDFMEELFPKRPSELSRARRERFDKRRAELSEQLVEEGFTGAKLKWLHENQLWLEFFQDTEGDYPGPDLDENNEIEDDIKSTVTGQKKFVRGAMLDYDEHGRLYMRNRSFQESDSQYFERRAWELHGRIENDYEDGLPITCGLARQDRGHQSSAPWSEDDFSPFILENTRRIAETFARLYPKQSNVEGFYQEMLQRIAYNRDQEARGEAVPDTTLNYSFEGEDPIYDNPFYSSTGHEDVVMSGALDPEGPQGPVSNFFPDKDEEDSPGLALALAQSYENESRPPNTDS